MNTTPQSTPDVLPILQLSDDLLLTVFSFISDVPYEFSTKHTKATLTHTLPLVCTKFHSLCKLNGDFLWKLAIERLIKISPSLWEVGIRNYIVTQHRSLPNIHSSNTCPRSVKLQNEAEESYLLRIATDLLKRSTTISMNNNDTCNQQIYKWILRNSVRYTSPIFFMPDNSVRLGHHVSLHFFEPRYRLLIAEVMDPYPEHYRNGEPIQPPSHDHNDLPYPTFIYANRSPLQSGTVCTIVQVRGCFIYPNGTADVILLPVNYAVIERVWIRPPQWYNLFEAQVVMMNNAEAEDFELRHTCSRMRIVPGGER